MKRKHSEEQIIYALKRLIDSFAPAQLTPVGAAFGSLSEAFPRLRIPGSGGALWATFGSLLSAGRPRPGIFGSAEPQTFRPSPFAFRLPPYHPIHPLYPCEPFSLPTFYCLWLQSLST